MTTPATWDLVNNWLIGYPLKTRSDYRRDVRQFMDWWKQDLLAATRTDIQRWLSDLVELDQKPSTLRRKASALSSFYTWCVSEKILDHNPCDNLRRPKGDPEPEMGLDLHQAHKLIAQAAAHSIRSHALIWLLCGAGLRVAEACNAQIEDLDLAAATLVVTVKGGHRKIKPLSRPVIAAITTTIEDRDSGKILTNQEGRPLTPKRAWELVGRLATAAGIKNCHPHTLRHTAATLALAAGALVEDVQELLGHRSIETTLRYLKNRDVAGGTRNAAQRLGDILDPTGTDALDPRQDSEEEALE